jgi:sulfur-oxidizing protein SoxX
VRTKLLFALLVSINLPIMLVTGASAEELVKYKIKNFAIRSSLTGKPGNPENGKEVAINRQLGNCLACHVMPVNEPFQGNVGPPLNGVGSRYSEGQLRLRIVNPKVLNPMTIMPAFYRVDGLHRVEKKFQGEPILTAQQVEDVVAYLMTLKSP